MSQQQLEKVRTCLDAWNQGDIEAWLKYAHPQVEWTSDVARQVEGADSVYRGTEGLRRFWEEYRLVWGVAIDVSEMRDSGDTVVVLGRIRAHGGASGVDLQQPIAYVFEFDGGLARKVRGYLDPNQALEAAGVSEAQK